MKQVVFWQRLMTIGLISLSLWGMVPAAAQDIYHIVFVSNRDGNDEVYVMEADGKQPTNISRSRARDWHPDWSPDGQKIVFTSDRDGNQELYVMNNNGTDQQNITNSPKNENSPAWAPDGAHIVFGSDRDGGQDLYLLDVQTKAVTRLTSDGITKSAPAWSPDSKQVVYWQTDGDQPHIFAVEVASGQVRRLTDQGANNWPAWSPEGGFVIFENKTGGEPDIYSLNLADNTVVNLTNNPASDIRPAWSPDGKQIVFASNRDGSYDLYVMNADGSLPHRVLALNGDEQSPAWQPKPAPVKLPENGGVVVQNYTQLDMNNLSGELNNQKVLGGGDMQLLAPEEATTNQVIKVRLEIDLRPKAVVEATPDMPTPTPKPNVAALSQREQLYLDKVYLIMGAELTGIDLDRFKVLPDPSEYVLRLRDDAVNFWEWTLRPKGTDAIGTNFLSVQLYAPEKLADGSIAKTVLQDVDFQIEVTNAAAATPIPPTPTPLIPTLMPANEQAQQIFSAAAAVPEARFSIIYPDPDSLTLIVRQQVNLAEVAIASKLSEEWIKGFDGLSMLNYVALPGMCFQYVRYQTRPPLARDCNPQSVTKLEIPGSDVFWYDAVSAQFLMTAIKDGQSFLGVCNGGDIVCNF